MSSQSSDYSTPLIVKKHTQLENKLRILQEEKSALEQNRARIKSRLRDIKRELAQNDC